MNISENNKAVIERLANADEDNAKALIEYGRDMYSQGIIRGGMGAVLIGAVIWLACKLIKGGI